MWRILIPPDTDPLLWALQLPSLSHCQCGSEAGDRQAPQGKAVGDSFSIDQNSKIRIAGQLREEAGPCPDYMFLFSASGDCPDHTYTEKAPWRPKRSHVKRCSTQMPFCWIHLGYERLGHAREDPEIYQIWAVNQTNQNDWPKESRKKCPIKVIQTATRA